MENNDIQKKSVWEQLLDGLLMGFGTVLPGIVAVLDYYPDAKDTPSVLFTSITLTSILVTFAKDTNKKRIFLGIVVIFTVWYVYTHLGWGA